MNVPLLLYAMAGGAVGTGCRYLLTAGIQSRLLTTFPTATLLINVTGSVLLGFLMRYAVDTSTISAELKLVLTTGFCGGYTTFSTFSYETAKLLESGDYRHAALYTLLSVALSLGGTLAGFGAASALLAMQRVG